MFKRLLLASVFALPYMLPVLPAHAQNPTCPTRLAGDSTNACASTAFVHQGFQPTLPNFSANNPLIGNGTNVPTQGTRSGTTSVYPVIDGTSTNGQCATFDASGGLTSQACSGSGSGTVGSGLQGNLAGYTANGTSVVGIPISCVPIETFGGNGNGSTDNTAALNAELASFGTGSGCVGFGAGTYSFTSAISFTYSGTIQSVAFRGGGSDVSVLLWPTATGGITLNASSAHHTFHFSDLTFATGTTAGGTGLAVNQSSPLGNFGINDVTRVNFRGIDGGAATDYWSTGMISTGYSGINFDTDEWFGAGSNGNGLQIQGDVSTSPFYGIVFNFTNCSWFSGETNFTYGSYIQGVQMVNSNFTNGITGINSASGETGTLGELAITNSQFDNTGNDILLQTPVEEMFLMGNTFFVSTGNSGFACTGTCGGLLAMGNNFGSLGGPSTNAGISMAANTTPSAISNNQFIGLTFGITMGTTTKFVVIQGNGYAGNTTNVNNAGGTACPASAAGNCIGTATP